MARVHGGDVNTGVELATLATWGSQSGIGGYLRLPIDSDGVKIEQEGEETNDEISASGARDTYEAGRFLSRGQLVVPAYYDLPVIWQMIANGMGGMERFGADASVLGLSSSGGDFSGTHIFTPQDFGCQTVGSKSARPIGFCMRHTKGGAVAGGHRNTRPGMQVSGWSFVQPENDYPHWEFDVIAVNPETPTAGGSLAAKPAGLTRLKPGHLSSAVPTAAIGGVFTFGTYSPNMLSFSIRYSNGMRIPPAMAQAPDAVPFPLHGDQHKVTGEVVLPFEQVAYNASDVPWLDYIYQNISSFRAVYGGETLIASTSPPITQAMMISLPNISVTNVDDPIDDEGRLTVRIEFEGAVGDIIAALNPTEDDYHVPLMVGVHGLSSIDSDTTYLPASKGGNDVPPGEFRTDN